MRHLRYTHNLIIRLKQTTRSTINTKTENVDTTTGLPPWETVQGPTMEEVGETIQERKEESNVEPIDVHPIQNSNHNQAPPGVAQVLLDSGWFIDALVCLSIANDHSTRRGSESTHDFLVFRRILHWSLRRTAKSSGCSGAFNSLKRSPNKLLAFQPGDSEQAKLNIMLLLASKLHTMLRQIPEWFDNSSTTAIARQHTNQQSRLSLEVACNR